MIPGRAGRPSMAGSKAATAASPSAIPSCGPARARSGCGRRTRRPSPTTSSSAWSAPPWKPDREFLPCTAAARRPVAGQAFLRILDQQVADGKATTLGLGGEPLRQLRRHDHRPADAVISFPHLAGQLRHAHSFPPPWRSARPARRNGAGCGRSAGRGSSGWGNPVPSRARRPAADAAAGSGRRRTDRALSCVQGQPRPARSAAGRARGRREAPRTSESERLTGDADRVAPGPGKRRTPSAQIAFAPSTSSTSSIPSASFGLSTSPTLPVSFALSSPTRHCAPTASRPVTSPVTISALARSAISRRYWLHCRCVGRNRPRSTQLAYAPCAIRCRCQL